MQISMPRLATNWIMACVRSTTYSIPVNGNPTPFFKSFRGIRQGCPLSPLLFLLVIEGFSLLMGDARDIMVIKGVKISKGISISHLLFVDDVIFFGAASVDEWKCISDILSLFCSASRMQVSHNKSVFFCTLSSRPVLDKITIFLPYKIDELKDDIMYLAFL